jgi:hypothetical protein
MTENIIFIKIEIIVVAILCWLFLLWLKKWANWEDDNSIWMSAVFEVLFVLAVVIVYVITY